MTARKQWKRSYPIAPVTVPDLNCSVNSLRNLNGQHNPVIRAFPLTADFSGDGVVAGLSVGQRCNEIGGDFAGGNVGDGGIRLDACNLLNHPACDVAQEVVVAGINSTLKILKGFIESGSTIFNPAPVACPVP